MNATARPLGRLAILGVFLLSGACSGSGKSGTQVAGEGVVCSTSAPCASGQLCASTGDLAGAASVCRTECASGCSNGETCNADNIKNASGADDGTCQCTPVSSPGVAGDPCTADGLVCNPTTFVCEAAEPAGTQCAAGKIYSANWSLCLLQE